MYDSISGGTACVRRMNGTHQIGCTCKFLNFISSKYSELTVLFAANRKGSVGIVHYVEAASDLDFILENGSSPPYIPVIPTSLFDLQTAEKLVHSEKVSGLVLYMPNGTQLDHFTHDRVCPNAASNLNNTCSKNWNPRGTGLNYADFPFPIFYAKQDGDVAKIRDCFAKFNNFSFEDHSLRSLCALEIKAFMFATTDTPTCLRRSNSLLNVNPMKFCDPLAGDNVWASVFPVAEENRTESRERKFIVLAARSDATSLFYELVPGAESPVTGIVALLSTAQILKRMLRDEDGGKYGIRSRSLGSCFVIFIFLGKNVLFVFFSGESYDYMGSQRLLYDMENGEFPVSAEEASDVIPQIRPENISLFIEFSQLSHKGGVFAHILENNTEISEFFNKLNRYKTPELELAPSLGILPPASLQTFAKHERGIPGLVLADHRDAYVNKFYNSIYDDSSNIQFHFYENVTESDSSAIPLGDLQWFVANVSEMVAKSVYEEVTGKPTDDRVKADLPLVRKGFHEG